MTIAEKAAAIAADISISHTPLAEVSAAGPFGPLLQALVAMLMQALTGCGISPAAAAAMMQQQTGLLGRLHKGMLRRVLDGGLRRLVKGSDVRAQLLEPITNSFFKQGLTTKEEDVVSMMAEAKDVLARMSL